MKNTWLWFIINSFVLLLSFHLAFAQIPPLSPDKPLIMQQSFTGVARIINVVDSYCLSVRSRDWNTAYSLLSAATKKSLPLLQWQQEMASTVAVIPDAASLPAGADQCRITDTVFSDTTAQVVYEATYTIPSRIVLVKEGEDWKVDLPATSQKMITDITDTVRQYITGKTENVAAAARWSLSPYVTNHRVEVVEMEANKAIVKLVETAVVKVPLALQRVGPYWQVVPPTTVILTPTPASSVVIKPAPTQQTQPKPPIKPGEVFPGPRHWRQ